MRSTYFTGYFPLISIILFSLSYAIYSEGQAMEVLKTMGLYGGLLEFFSDTGIKLTLLFILFLLFFMMFSALKLIADTLLQISLLLFSKEISGDSLKSVRVGSIIYLIGSGVSIFCNISFAAITLVFFITSMIAFTYFIYKASAYLSSAGLMGMIFFHTFVWCSLIAVVGYSVLKLYNSLLASLPI
ncbi:DUF5366 family protein [Bacillus massiliigorillae]|uniref:DUF5366 family protein n=1 Tax=Bacillus massiliigorillae TaxID=1243664 RepID=UPI00039BA298|nr:DUF5366 family protein [Bacillus massiliigorillae]